MTAGSHDHRTREAHDVQPEPQAGMDGTGEMAAISDDAVVRRTKDGWRVGGDDLPDLTSAMILADLLAAEQGGTDGQVTRKPAPEQQAGETGKLRATVSQLEHALLARVRVEQAIGVLAERHRIKPRQAFEQLRTAARNRGRKVIDIASDVVASASNPLLQLPEELSRPRADAAPRRAPAQRRLTRRGPARPTRPFKKPSAQVAGGFLHRSAGPPFVTCCSHG